MRQQLEFQKSRSTMQALMSQKGAEEKHIQEVFEDLKEAFFPYDKNERRADIDKMKQAMYSELARGPLELTVMEDPNKRKVNSRLQKGTEELRRKGQLQESGGLRTLDDVFAKARRRTRSTAS